MTLPHRRDPLLLRIFLVEFVLFDDAHLVGAVFAGEERVGLLHKSLGVAVVGDLPEHGAHQREADDAPRPEVRDEDERRRDHDRAPGENAAGDAAFVLHHQLLERAVEHDANEIGDIVERRQQHHRRHADDAAQIQHREDQIERDPQQRHARRAEVEAGQMRAEAKIVDEGLDLVEMLRKLLEAAAADAGLGRELKGEGDDEKRPQQVDRVKQRAVFGEIQRLAVSQERGEHAQQHERAERKAHEVRAQHFGGVFDGESPPAAALLPHLFVSSLQWRSVQRAP